MCVIINCGVGSIEIPFIQSINEYQTIKEKKKRKILIPYAN